MTRSTWDDLPDASEAIGFFEMVLEVADLAESEAFYVDALGLMPVERWQGEREAVWLSLGAEGFLGIWTRETGGDKAIHGGRGGAHVHFAYRVPIGTLDSMEARLEALGHDVERRAFGPGDVAIYIDDPDGNVVEITERVTLWDGTAASR